jgi:hypothetical protein
MDSEKDEIAKGIEVKKDDVYYFDDGDLIIEILDGSVLTVFRVHSKILARCSKFFNSLLDERSQWAELNTSIEEEGVKTKLQLLEETPKRFRRLLDWAYPEQPIRIFSNHLVKSMLVISDRYLCDALKQTCKNQLPLLPDNYFLLRSSYELGMEALTR